MFNLLTSNVATIVDVVVIVVLLVFGILGLVRGFVKTFIKIFGTFLALLLAVLLASKVTIGLENKFGLVGWVGGGLEGVLNNIFGEAVMNTTLEQASRSYLTENGVGNWLINIILETQADGSIPLDVTLNQIICPSFAYYVAMVMVVILLFIIFKIIFFLIGTLFKKLHAIKIIKIVDCLLGLVLGLISGLMILEVLIMIVGIIPVDLFNEIHYAATTNGFAGFIHNINIFNLILNNIALGDIVEVVKGLVAKIP